MSDEREPTPEALAIVGAQECQPCGARGGHSLVRCPDCDDMARAIDELAAARVDAEHKRGAELHRQWDRACENMYRRVRSLPRLELRLGESVFDLVLEDHARLLAAIERLKAALNSL